MNTHDQDNDKRNDAPIDEELNALLAVDGLAGRLQRQRLPHCRRRWRGRWRGY